CVTYSSSGPCRCCATTVMGHYRSTSRARLPRCACSTHFPYCSWVDTTHSWEMWPELWVGPSLCGERLFTGGPDCSTPYRDCVEQRSEEHTSELQSRFDLVCRL